MSEYQEKIFITSHSNEGTQLAESEKGKLFLKLIEKYVPDRKNCSILDLGCNDGGFTDKLRESGYNSIGADLPKVVQLAKKKYPNSKFKAADLSKKFPFPDMSFDVLIASEIIEHLDDDKKFLSECHKVLKNNGIIILTTPNKFYFVYRALILLGWEWEDALTEVETHMHSYSFKKLADFFRNYGFEILERKGLCYDDSKLKSIEKMLPKNFRFVLLFVARKK